MEKICILLRVYNRLEDLKYCIQIIKDTWTSYDYYIIVVSNGASKGYTVNKELHSQIDKLIELEENAGHLKGNTQLLLNGILHIPDTCDYTIILEADTWIYSDKLIEKYINNLKLKNAEWASAMWYNYVCSFATDFAIIKTYFLKDNLKIFDFTIYPELSVAEYIKDVNAKYIYITEIAPINLPKYIIPFPHAPSGRFNVFFKAKMVTHHSEQLRNGITQKKKFFNLVSNKIYFDVASYKFPRAKRIQIKITMIVSYVFPHKSWILFNRK